MLRTSTPCSSMRTRGRSGKRHTPEKSRPIPMKDHWSAEVNVTPVSPMPTMIAMKMWIIMMTTTPMIAIRFRKDERASKSHCPSADAACDTGLLICETRPLSSLVLPQCIGYYPTAAIWRRTNAAWIAAVAESAPLFSLASGPPARSTACWWLATVSTPLPIGTPLSRPTRVSPYVTASQTTRKCSVSPSMTQPVAMTASKFLQAAATTTGSSRAPATRQSSTLAPSSRAAVMASAWSLSVISAFHWALMTATRSPSAAPGPRAICGIPSAGMLILLRVSVGGRYDVEVVELVAHLVPLGLQVTGVVLGRRWLHRDAAGNGYPEVLEALLLRRIIGDQVDAFDPEFLDDRCGRAVLAGVSWQAQGGVRFHGVQALVVEDVGTQLRNQADPAPLLVAKVDDDAVSFVLDGVHGGVELLAAVAAQRAEDIAGETLGVHADRDVLLAGDVPVDESDVLGAVDEAGVAYRAELAAGRWQPGLGIALYGLLGGAAVLDELLDGNHAQAMLVSEAAELRAAGHIGGVVLRYNLTQHTDRSLAGQSGQVHGGLGVAIAGEHATPAGTQRDDVAGAS